MREMKVPAYSAPLFISTFLVAALAVQMAVAQSLHAQTQAAAPPPAAANEKYVLCFADPTGPVAYVNEIFAAVMPQLAPSGMRGGDESNQAHALQPLFLAFLQKKNGPKYQGGVSCVTIFPPNAAGFEAAKSHKQRVEDLAKKNKAQIVETDWKYAP